jgi:pilus assembly protein CpaB
VPLRLLVAFILLAASSGLGLIAYKALNPQPVNAAAPTMVRIFVARAPTPAGTLLKQEDMRERAVAPGEVPRGAVLATEDGRAELQGAMARRFFGAGEIILADDVLRPRDRGFLAAVLRPGLRAVAIGVDANTGAAGLIFPGDFVDVILTQSFGAQEASAGRRMAAETVLAGVRVIAVDQQITQGAPVSAVATGTPSSRVARTVTLEVTPEQAERLALAERLGRLTLALRAIDAPAEGEEPRPTTTVFGADVSPALNRSEPNAAHRMRVIQGSTSGEVVFR